MAVNVSNPADLRGADVVGTDGDKIGKVDEVYLDNETDAPEWAAVKTGLFGGNVSLVPLATASFEGGDLVVPFTKDKVKGAPNHDPGRELSADDERELFTYYGVDYGGETVTATGGVDTDQSGYVGGDADRSSFSAQADADRAGTVDTGYAQTSSTTGTTQSTVSTDRERSGDAGVVGRDTSGPTTDDAMTRSEERLHVGTTSRESGRARLRKFITTEQETRTVPVSHEEITVSREPITDANRGDALSGGDLTEEEHEVTLHAEQAVASKETVPVERVQLGKHEVTEEQTVNADVRKENIELEGDGDARGDVR